MINDITSMEALRLARKIKDKELSVIEVLRTQLNAVYEREPLYNSYITIMEDEAYRQAKFVQQRIDTGGLADSPLAGGLVAIKDNICTKSVRTTCASKMLEEFIPSYDATVIERLKEAGVILIGKVNLDEFAMGGTTTSSYFGATKNPWNVKHVPGGSSGGSASVVAAEEAYISLGSDTGGSIRQPASFCGVVGIKPTYGTVSRYGLIPFAPSLDQIGPIGRCVSDCVAMLEVISGHDPKDSTSIRKKNYSYREALVDDIKGMRIGIPKLYLDEGLDDDVHKKFTEVVKTYKGLGADVEFFDMNVLRYSPQAYFVISCAEATSSLSRFDGLKYGYGIEEYEGIQELYIKSRSEAFGDEVKRRIMLGAFTQSPGKYEDYYNKARKIRRLIYQAYEEAFEKYDVLLSPEQIKTAPPLNYKVNDPKEKHQSEMLNASVNLAGLPAVCLPCGQDRNGLPIGIQLIAKQFGEKNIIRAAYAFEQTRPYERPSILT